MFASFASLLAAAGFLGQSRAGFGAMIVAMTVFIVFMLMGVLLLLMKQYKRCPPDKMLVIWGKDTRDPQTLTNGAQLVFPLIQDYAYLDLLPLKVELAKSAALAAKRSEFDVPREYTVAIGTEPELAAAAAKRLLRLTRDEISAIADEVIGNGIAKTLDAVQSQNIDAAAFYAKLEANVQAELRTVGLALISVRRL